MQSVCVRVICSIAQLFRTDRNTRLDSTSLVSTCLASPQLASPRVDFMCGLWQSCSLINDSCNAISIGFQWPQCNRARVRQREREWKGTCIVLRLFSICQCTNRNCHTFFTVYFPFSTTFINFNSKTYSSWSPMINMIYLSSLINGSCGLGDRKQMLIKDVLEVKVMREFMRLYYYYLLSILFINFSIYIIH